MAARGLLLTGIACGLAGLAGGGPTANGAAAAPGARGGAMASRAQAGGSARAEPAWARPAWTRAPGARAAPWVWVPRTRLSRTRAFRARAGRTRPLWARAPLIRAPLARRARTGGEPCGDGAANRRLTAVPDALSAWPSLDARAGALAWAGLAGLVLLAGGLLAVLATRPAGRVPRGRALAAAPDEPDVADISHLVDRAHAAGVIDVTSENEWGWAPGPAGPPGAGDTSGEAPGPARHFPA